MSKWYHIAELPDSLEWRGFQTVEYIRASEDPFKLNLLPEQMFLTPEETQASDTDWIKDGEPIHSWTVESEPSHGWYIEPELEFYWRGIDDFVPFYAIPEVAPQFYWTTDEELLFYYTKQVEPSTINWGGFYLAPNRFSLLPPRQTSFYWVLLTDPLTGI